MGKGALKPIEIYTLAHALLDGKTKVDACKMAGLSYTNATRTCSNRKVIARMAQIQAEKELINAKRDKLIGAKEPLTLREFQMFLETRMLDPNNKDASRYAEMYGKTIHAFTEKIELDTNVSYADMLNDRLAKTTIVNVIGQKAEINSDDDKQS